jgi:hypothetical protein
MLTNCFVSGEHNKKDDLRNGEFTLPSINECAFKCSHTAVCAGFSYNTVTKACTFKTTFSYIEVNEVEDVISGPKEPCGKYNANVK